MVVALMMHWATSAHVQVSLHPSTWTVRSLVRRALGERITVYVLPHSRAPVAAVHAVIVRSRCSESQRALFMPSQTPQRGRPAHKAQPSLWYPCGLSAQGCRTVWTRHL